MNNLRSEGHTEESNEKWKEHGVQISDYFLLLKHLRVNWSKTILPQPYRTHIENQISSSQMYTFINIAPIVSLILSSSNSIEYIFGYQRMWYLHFIWKWVWHLFKTIRCIRYMLIHPLNISVNKKWWYELV